MKTKICLTGIVVVLVIGIPFISGAQQDRGQGVRIKGESGQELSLYAGSYALVIGINKYNSGWPDLPGVKRDIEDINNVLREHGFSVITVTNSTKAQMDRSISDFISKYGQGRENRLLIYFAGHGHTIDSVGGLQGYIVPSDAPDPRRNEVEFKYAAISMDEIEAHVRKVEAKHLLWVFDSCFSGALFDATRSVPPAITSRTSMPVRQFITAGTADQRVPDKSIFREQFVDGLRGEADTNQDGYVTGEELGLFLNNRVSNYTRNSQTPQHGKIRNPMLDKGDFVFALPKRLPPPPDPEIVDWNVIVDSEKPEDFQNYIKKYCPRGIYCRSANATLRLLKQRPEATPNIVPSSLLISSSSVKAPFIKMSVAGVPLTQLPSFTTVTLDTNGKISKQKKIQECFGYIEDLGNGVMLEMVEIPSGEFLMGVDRKASDEYHRECARYVTVKSACTEGAAAMTPQHRVKVNGFLIGKYEVTQAQWKAVMGSLPESMKSLDEKFKGDNLPVVSVSWNNIKEFLKKLGKDYRLPSEAEWEYAARAGTQTPFAFGSTITPNLVNYHGSYPYGKANKGEFRGGPLVVGGLNMANSFGLYDMHGNVWEWCEDGWHENYIEAPGDGSTWINSHADLPRVVRGGGWNYIAAGCWSAYRIRKIPDDHSSFIGFRLVKSSTDIIKNRLMELKDDDVKVQPIGPALRPTILYKEKARYTRAAMDHKVEGTVILNIVFQADGNIGNIQIVKSLPHGLTENSIEAAKKIKFKPAEKDGKTVSVRGDVEFKFQVGQRLMTK